MSEMCFCGIAIKAAEEEHHGRRQFELHGLHIVVVRQHGPKDRVDAEVKGDVGANRQQQAKRFESGAGPFTQHLAGHKEHEVNDELRRGVRARIDFLTRLD